MANLTQELLKEHVSYDPLTGSMVRLSTTREITTVCKGYKVAKVLGKDYKQHRLAWLYMTGEFPVNVIDHKDQDTTNNIWTNLRDVTISVNTINQRPQGAVPHKGISINRYGTGYQVSLVRNGDRVWAGCNHATIEQAIEARDDLIARW